tara:strand:+ start:1058 stop:1240 length:183 start_codon:yes stop_codon:yes gene_type:complete
MKYEYKIAEWFFTPRINLFDSVSHTLMLVLLLTGQITLIQFVVTLVLFACLSVIIEGFLK